MPLPLRFTLRDTIQLEFNSMCKHCIHTAPEQDREERTVVHTSTFYRITHLDLHPVHHYRIEDRLPASETFYPRVAVTIANNHIAILRWEGTGLDPGACTLAQLNEILGHYRLCLLGVEPKGPVVPM